MKWGGKGKQEEKGKQEKKDKQEKRKEGKGYSAEAGRLSYAL